MHFNDAKHVLRRAHEIHMYTTPRMKMSVLTVGVSKKNHYKGGLK